MEPLFEFLKTYGTQVAALGSAIAFFFGLGKYLLERRNAQRWKEFDTYHRLIRELVEPDEYGGMKYLDRQTAVLFELRFYKRYFPHTLRMLASQQKKWSDYPRLVTESDSTIKYIRRKSKCILCRCWCFGVED